MPERFTPEQHPSIDPEDAPDLTERRPDAPGRFEHYPDDIKEQLDAIETLHADVLRLAASHDDPVHDAAFREAEDQWAALLRAEHSYGYGEGTLSKEAFLATADTVHATLTSIKNRLETDHT